MWLLYLDRTVVGKEQMLHSLNLAIPLPPELCIFLESGIVIYGS
jgi:hypothetical protein